MLCRASGGRLARQRPLVTGFGGTQLQLNAAGQRTAQDRVWNNTYSTTVRATGQTSPPSEPGLVKRLAATADVFRRSYNVLLAGV